MEIQLQIPTTSLNFITKASTVMIYWVLCLYMSSLSQELLATTCLQEESSICLLINTMLSQIFMNFQRASKIISKKSLKSLSQAQLLTCRLCQTQSIKNMERTAFLQEHITSFRILRILLQEKPLSKQFTSKGQLKPAVMIGRSQLTKLVVS